MTIHADAVGHLAVTWRIDASPDPDVLSRLDAVAQALVERGLPDGLLPEEGPDELVCVRRLALPPHRMHWGEQRCRAGGSLGSGRRASRARRGRRRWARRRPLPQRGTCAAGPRGGAAEW